MTGIFWPLWWVCEAILIGSTVFVLVVPVRRARQASQSAVSLHEEAIHGIQTGRPFAEADTLFHMAQMEWVECFAWHALTRRIYRVTTPLSIGFALFALGHLALVVGLP